MHQLPIDKLVLFLIQEAALLVLIVRLWNAGLHRVYPYFFGYLLADFIEEAIFWAIPYRSRSYVYFWLVSEGIDACFYALIVSELYKIVLRDLPGIASISRRYLKVTLAIAIATSLLLLRLEEAPANVVSTFLVIERAIVFSVVIFILLVTAFLVYYPISLNRNVVAYSVGYAVYFLCKATGLFIRTLGHYVLREINTILIAVSAACLVFWAITLSRRGEERLVVVGHQWNRDDEQRLLSKIRAINDNLVSTGKE
jgi:hypothetical protein